MPFSLPHIPYPTPYPPYWGPVTATLNWCEEDYYLTTYSAEIVNALTNLVFVYLAYKGISNCIRNGHDSVFLLGFISYLVIGLGSFFFHTTLKYSMQLLDELSMIYTTCVMFFAIFAHGKSTRTRVLVGVFATGIAVFVTGYYLYIKDPVFHQNAFALITTIVLLRSIYSMEESLRPSRTAKRAPANAASEVERVRRERRDQEILNTMWFKMIPIGLGSVGLGFLIWNLDTAFCSHLRSWRRQMGLPWGIFLEGHGWWHVFTGIAQYFNLTWSIWLRYCLDGRQDEVELVWPSLFTSMPLIERVDRENVPAKKRQ
ncbi:hypothetical protein PV11_03667 [Exophiala sideris]|uniref:Alkaline ceramidase 3 n=1 Tax=Exophiala sideris TaxID=1016849 RepID=A0A0D1YEZ7_9EURO|nr:hypothetical protein PV11_03667 [Exophiala sideris]